MKKTAEEFFASLAEPGPSKADELAAAHAAPAADDADDADADADADDDSDDSDDSDARGVAPPDDTDAPPASDADVLKAALRSGDLAAVATLLGDDPAEYARGAKRWAAGRRREMGLQDQVERVKADAAAVVAQYEPFESQIDRYHEKKDPAALRRLVELATGSTWASVRDSLLADTAPRPSDADDTLPTAEDVDLDVPRDHAVRQLPDWQDAVLRELRASVNKSGDPTISARRAAAKAVKAAKASFDKLSKAFGAAPAPAEPEQPKTKAKRKLSADEFFARYQ